jgi:hypothetical protein
MKTRFFDLPKNEVRKRKESTKKGGYCATVLFWSLITELSLVFRVCAYAPYFSNWNISLPLPRLQHLTMLSRWHKDNSALCVIALTFSNAEAYMPSFVTQILIALSYWCKTYLKLNWTIISKKLTTLCLYFDNFQIWTAIGHSST